ncbi:ankyrin repeat protein [Colletotrichum plurivorum]|uniref:Ankyrin repeat protein n=1 Tax=Colletotrichum plurivorum TaxID=2175906 RepID=A0A8H6K5I4_9PEZI|nr:ankyrin repeat protein [Colletotrichum plurivorum]
MSGPQAEPDSTPAPVPAPAPSSNGASEKSPDHDGSLAVAIVLQWNEAEATAWCPFCLQRHKHAVKFFKYNRGGYPARSPEGRYVYAGTRSKTIRRAVAPCMGSESNPTTYRLLFPFEDDERVEKLGWEVGFSRKGPKEKFYADHFRTVGVSAPEKAIQTSNSNDVVQVTRQIESTRLEDVRISPKSVDATASTQKDQGDGKEVLSPTDSGVHLSINPDSTAPDIGIHACAARGDRARLHNLLEQEVDVDSRDQKQRTPLMEAVLWTQPDIVRELLKAGADPELKDEDGRSAVDLAAETDRNEEERYRRDNQYVENPYEAKAKRRTIRGLLGAVPSFEAPKKTGIEMSENPRCYISQQDNTVTLISPEQGVPIDDLEHPVGWLERGGPFRTVVAEVGHDGPDDANPEALGDVDKLASGYWASETRRLAAEIGLPFAPHWRDEGKPRGTYNASHAEAKLMCYLARRHDVAVGDAADPVRGELLHLLSRRQELKIERARILTSRSPCPSCAKFKKQVEQQRDIEFELVVATEASTWDDSFKYRSGWSWDLAERRRQGRQGGF